MNRFTGLLKRTAARLDLPQPVKSRVLLEMAADLEDMFDVYRKRGLSEEEATQKVEETFEASDDTLTELTRLHRARFRNSMDHLSEQASTLWEKMMVVAVLLFVAASSGTLVLHPSFFADASVFVWPGVALGILAVLIFLVKTRQLFLKNDHASRHLRRGLPSLLFIACAALFNGAFGFFFGMQSSMFRIAKDSTAAHIHLTRWIVGGTSTMILSLLVAILVALLWFVLISKIKRIELRQAARLLEEA